MSQTRRLIIQVDQEGNAVSGLSGITGKLGGLGAMAGGAAVAGLGALAVGVGVAGSKLVSLGSDVQEMQGMFDVVFKDVGGDVTKQLDEFGKAVGRNKYDLRGYAAALGDTLKPMGFSEEAAGDLAVQITKLGVDLGSFKNMPATEALERLQGTLIGNHENALAFGVVINENTLKQELAAMGADKLTGAELEQAKVQARINLLIKGTTDAQGDAARTSDSWANQQRRLTDTLRETAQTMGTKLLPLVTPFLTKLNELVTYLAPLVEAFFEKITGEIGERLAPTLAEIKESLSRVAEAFGFNTDEIDGMDIAIGAAEITLKAIGVTMRIVAKYAENVAYIAEKIRYKYDQVSLVVRTLREIWEASTRVMKERIQPVKESVESFFNLLKRSASSVRSGLDKITSGFKRMLDAIRDVKDKMPSWLIPGSPTPFERGLTGIANASGRAGDAIKRAMPQLGLGAPTQLAPAASGGSGGVQIIVQYQPGVSFATATELERNLSPVIKKVLRQMGVKQ